MYGGDVSKERGGCVFYAPYSTPLREVDQLMPAAERKEAPTFITCALVSRQHGI